MVRLLSCAFALAAVPLLGDSAPPEPASSQPVTGSQPADRLTRDAAEHARAQAIETRLHELERQVSLLIRRVGGPERNLISQSPAGLETRVESAERRLDRLDQRLRGLEQSLDRLERRLERLERPR